MDWVSAGVVVLVLLTGGVAVFWMYLVWRAGFAKGWRAGRAGRPFCPTCQYDLSGAAAIRCPECGVEHDIGKLLLFVPDSRRA